MSVPAPFAALRYEIVAAPGAPVFAEPMTEREAAPLAEAVAALEPWRTYAYPAAKLAAFLAKHEPSAPRFLFRRDGKVLGAVVVRLNWMRGPYIQFLAVLPPYQRQGLGTAAVAWVEAQARIGEERNLWIAASEINEDARRLYEHLGFREVAKLDDLVCKGRAEILYRKRLS
jgi:ribosomal protein S18 acetylase RimI-like enzyme